MTQTHKLVPIEPTDEQWQAAFDLYGTQYHEDQMQSVIICIKEMYKAMLASVPEVGDAVADVADQTWTVIYDLYFALSGSPAQSATKAWEVKRLILGLTPQPDRTAELEDKVKRLVEALREAIQREYNSFEPDNQSSRYYRWSALLAEMEAKG